MRKYPEYKDSGVEWFESTPSSWIRNKFNRVVFFQEGPGLRNWQFTEDGVKVICVTNIVPPAIDFDIYNKNISEDDYLENYQHFTVNKGDLLLSSSGASWGKVSVFEGEEKVILNTSTIRLNTRDKNLLFKNLIKWILNSDYISEQLRILQTGSCQPNFGPTHLNKLICFYPQSISEQTTIANFLDHKTQLIDNLIAKKERLIELLKEERTAVINQAVTKGLPAEARAKAGLDPNVPMKDSGIEWLGEIPERWGVKRLKFLVKNIIDKTKPSGFKIALENIESGTGRFITPDNPSDLTGDMNLFIKGDVLFSKLRPYLTKVLLADHYGASVGEILVLRPESIIESKFLFYRLLSRDFIEIVNGSTYGAKMPRASWEDFIRNLFIPFPRIDEQMIIVNYLDGSLEFIDNSIQKMGKEIELYNEYKTSLINEAVTGKIDVRDYKA